MALPGHRTRAAPRTATPPTPGWSTRPTAWPSNGPGTAPTPANTTTGPGKPSNILFNVAESGCGSAPVTITNTATASLYNYTPYQPNPASLAAYPGEGDQCSSYGNRNFFFLYQSYFGSTGGGKPATTAPGGDPVGGTGTTVELPAAAGITGTVTAPTERAATAIRAALSWLGTPYAWGGGNSQGPTLGIRAGCSQLCQVYRDWTITGFDCSGLTLYAWAQAGVALPHGSYDQVNQGHQLPYTQALPGDLLFWGGTADPPRRPLPRPHQRPGLHGRVTAERRPASRSPWCGPAATSTTSPSASKPSAMQHLLEVLG